MLMWRSSAMNWLAMVLEAARLKGMVEIV